VEEEWSEYFLEDETIIRLKIVPLKIFMKNDNTAYSLNSNVETAAFSPQKLKGASSGPLPTQKSEIMKAVSKTDMKFEILSEPWNQYEIEGGVKLFIKSVATQISSSKLFDSHGDPIYIVAHQVLTKKIPP
jgi:hypothetical protein